MRSPIYATPPTADGKRSASKLSFVGEGGIKDVIDYPTRNTIPNPPRSREAAVYLKSKKISKSDQRKSMNYFNITASSISIGSRPNSSLKLNKNGNHSESGLKTEKVIRPKTAPNKKTGVVKKESDINLEKNDQRAPLVPTEVER